MGLPARITEWAKQRLARRFRGLPAGRVEVVFSRRYRLDLAGMAHDPRRGSRILAYVAGRGLLGTGTVHPAPLASFKMLCRVHEVPYLESLGDPDALTRVVGQSLGERERDRVVEVQRRMAGGTRLAVSLARKRAADGGRVAFNVGGGLHHAFPDHGERFCLLNDVAAAVAAERAAGFDGPVLIVDCDLHDGDGTRAIFARDDSVHTLSFHNGSSGTDPDAVASTSVELGSGVDDATFLAALHEHLPPLVDAVRPRLAIYLAGVDVAADDSLGDWKLSDEGIFERDRFVTRLLRDGERPVPLAVVLAGGYGREAWRYSARYLAWLLGGGEVEPPTSEEVTLARFRRLARLFDPEELSGETGDGGGGGEVADWGLTEEDVLGALGGGGRRHRFLDFYSLHGVELALERTGMLDHLRRLGFSHPRVDFDLDNPAGETVRVFGNEAGDELLVELRARRDRRSLPDFEMLRIEWLLLQNPRARFAAERPPLPGQQHPGLGMLEETVAVLILVCDRLGLDGLLFVPSHYHLAAQSRRFLHFLEPRHEALFRALRRAVGHLPLGEATRAVEDGRVVDAAGGETFQLPNMPMVLPTTDELEARLESEEYEAAVAAAEGDYAFRLRGEGAA